MANFRLKVLIVEDDPIDSKFFENIVRKSGGVPVLVRKAEDAVGLLAEGRYDLVLTDLMMDGMSGMDLLQLVKRYYQDVEVLIITAYASVENAVKAMKQGAFSYFIKGDPAQRLVKDLERIARLAQSRRDLFRNNMCRLESIVLETLNQDFRDVLNLARELAALHDNLFLVGRPGVCVQALAKYLHLLGENADKRFAHLTSLEISQLVLSYREDGQGGDSGTMWRELGECGTIFVEDVELVPAADFARFLSIVRETEKQLSEYSLARTRLVVSSSDLGRLPLVDGPDALGEFSLFLKIPPFHERVEDIPVMIDRLLPVLNEEPETNIACVTGDLREYLSRKVLLGSFDSLLALLRDIAQGAEGDTLGLAALEAVDVSRYGFLESDYLMPGEPHSLREAREIAEMLHIGRVLERTGGNRNRTAKALGITPRQLYNKLHQYDLD